MKTVRSKRPILITAVLTALFLAAAGAALYLFRQPIEKEVLQRLLNHAAGEYFNGSIRLNHVRIDKELKLHAKGLRGEFTTESGPLPVEVALVESTKPLTQLLWQKPLPLRFEGARPAASSQGGIHGEALVQGGENGFFELRGDVQSLWLQHLVRLNPEVLQGASGELKGEFTLKSTAGGDPAFQGRLRVEEPGGELQARLFDLLIPYLPQTQSTQTLEQLASSGAVIHYDNADLNLDMTETSRLKIFLRILVPEYNLDLHLNLEIRLSGEATFTELLDLLGIIKAAP